MKVRVWKHTPRDTPNGALFYTTRLPIRQRLIWAGPLFILVQR